MSMRAHRDELIQKGILLPDQPASTTAQQLPSISGELWLLMYGAHHNNFIHGKDL